MARTIEFDFSIGRADPVETRFSDKTIFELRATAAMDGVNVGIGRRGRIDELMTPETLAESMDALLANLASDLRSRADSTRNSLRVVEGGRWESNL